MRWVVIFVLVAFFSVGSAYADDEQAACFRSALDAHLEAKMKLFDAAGPLISPEAQIMRRRLDEKYCLVFTECGLRKQTSDARALITGTVFSSCLRKEEAEVIR